MLKNGFLLILKDAHKLIYRFVEVVFLNTKLSIVPKFYINELNSVKYLKISNLKNKNLFENKRKTYLIKKNEIQSNCIFLYRFVSNINDRKNKGSKGRNG